MGFLDWIRGRKKQVGATQAASNAPAQSAVPQVQPEAPATSGISVTPRTVMPLNPPRRLTKTTRKVADSSEPPPSADIPSKPLKFLVADLIPKLPEELRDFVTADLQTEIVISSDDIASDLVHGRATVALNSLLAACPDFFGGATPPLAPDRIALPLNKVVQQMGEFATRPDQEQPELPDKTFETPFLKGAIRDGEVQMVEPPAAPVASAPATPPPLPKPPPLPSQKDKQPTQSIPMPQVKATQPLPPVISPADKQGAASVPPSRFATTMIPDPLGRRKPPATVRASVAGGKIRVGGYTTSLIKLPSEEQQAAVKPEPSKPETSPPPSAPTIKMAESPIAKPKPPFAPPPTTPSTPQVSQVIPKPQPPSSLQPPLKPATPFPSPFAKAPETVKVSMMPKQVSRELQAGETKTVTSLIPPTSAGQPPKAAEPTQPAPSTPAVENIKISLASIVKSLPIDQIEGDPDDIDPALSVSLPISEVLGQLARGKVVTTVGVLRSALPESASRMFGDTADDAQITLPLKEVLAALPQDLLRKREDQVEENLDLTFETPFARKAEEDARRLAEEEAAKQNLEPAVPPTPEPAQVHLPTEPSSFAPEAEKDQVPVGQVVEPAPEEPLPPPQPQVQAPLPEPVSSPSAVRPKPPMPFISRRALRLEEHVKTAQLPPMPPLKEAPSPSPLAERPLVPPPAEAAATELSPKPEPAAPIIPDSPSIAETTSQEPAEAFDSSPASTLPSPAEASEISDADAASRKADAIAALQEIFMTEESMEARSVLAHILKLPGITGAMLGTPDGLKLAGALSSKFDADALCAITPSLLNRLGKFSEEVNMGALNSLTLEVSNTLLSIFSSNGVSLFIEHQRKEFAPGIRARLSSIIRHLSDIYR